MLNILVELSQGLFRCHRSWSIVNVEIGGIVGFFRIVEFLNFWIAGIAGILGIVGIAGIVGFLNFGIAGIADHSLWLNWLEFKITDYAYHPLGKSATPFIHPNSRHIICLHSPPNLKRSPSRTLQKPNQSLPPSSLIATCAKKPYT